ncbi:uncharacterized protein LOC115987239 [Quercus lobata]|uniref:uncharacterized protein LOC115987239 n=1 Tax=Quercus lobata TaxID=97700 RepID=UPI001245B216|nr:uncharacterized protein LOC115987239 [Quercus lobata]
MQLNVIVGVGINIRPKISSTLDRRYHEIFNEVDSLGTQRHQQNTDQIPIGGQWQLIIKLAGAKRKRAKRSAYAYEARNLQGEVVFCGIRSCATGSIVGAVQEAIVEAAVKAKNLGYQQILMLSNCKKLVQVVDKKRAPDWKERTLMADMSSLQQMGLDCRLIFVSKVILNYVWSLAILATKEPTYYCWPTMEHDVNATYG